MKPSRLCAALLVTLAIGLWAASALASGRHPASAAPFESSPGWAKIDLRSRTAWSEAIAANDRSVALECLLKLAHPATAEDKAQLARAGFEVRTAAGPILTGSVAAGRLPGVANLEIVQAIELATPLSPKAK